MCYNVSAYFYYKKIAATNKHLLIKMSATKMSLNDLLLFSSLKVCNLDVVIV